MEEEIRRSSPSSENQENGTRSGKSAVEKECLSFLISFQESFQYVKAKFVGMGKKMRARTEKEAMEGDLEASKMEVQAADDAEKAKQMIFNS